MATNLTESTEVIMSPKEAEAIFELWAKRQSEGESLRQRMSVQDLAEAMSIPPSEVEQMLSYVRSAHIAPTEPAKVKKARPVNSFLISIVAVTWFVILIGCCYLFYGMGYGNGRRVNLFAPPAPMEYPVTAADLPSSAADQGLAEIAPENLASQIPRGAVVEFDGYRVRGENAKESVTEEEVQNALNSIVQKVSPASVVLVSRPNINEVAIINALQENDASKVYGRIRFATMKVSLGNSVFEQLIPITKMGDKNLNRFVHSEQEKRLRILGDYLVTQRPAETPRPAR